MHGSAYAYSHPLLKVRSHKDGIANPAEPNECVFARRNELDGLPFGPRSVQRRMVAFATRSISVFMLSSSLFFSIRIWLEVLFLRLIVGPLFGRFLDATGQKMTTYGQKMISLFLSRAETKMLPDAA